MRAKCFKERYNATLLYQYHHHNNIQRILIHLNIIGFREYAVQLVKFLRYEIYSPNGELRELATKSEFRFENWGDLGEIDAEDENQKENLERLLKLPIEEINRKNIIL